MNTQLSYYPGCTLKTRAKNFEDSAIAAMAALGVDLVELPRWNCCGTVFSLAEDDIVHHVAPVRNLIRARQQGSDRLVTLCSFCYNTLKRADRLTATRPDVLKTLNLFMDDEPDYDGGLEVMHLLQVLRDDLGWDTVAAAVKRPLTGFKLAAYYGCTLTRPAEAAIDSIDNPTVLDDLLRTIGATPVDFPLATECCGSFEIVNDPESVSQRTRQIVGVAARQGAEAIVVSCPLCCHNLGERQAVLAETRNDFQPLPIVYFSQLLALALGVDPAVCHFELNFGDAEEWLTGKGLLAPVV